MPLDPLEGDYKEVYREPNLELNKQSVSRVVCPSCSKDIKIEDVNIQDKIAKCGSCQSIFSIQPVINSLLTPTPLHNKPIVGKQQGIEVSEYKDELNIAVNNYDGTMFGAAAMLLSFMALFTLMAFLESKSYAYLVGLIALANFIYVIYASSQIKKTKTFIDVDDINLRVSAPKNLFFRTRKYKVSKIRQFYSSNFQMYMIYDGDKGEEQIKFGPKLKSRARALYLEQELERFLGIPDETMPDES